MFDSLFDILLALVKLLGTMIGFEHLMADCNFDTQCFPFFPLMTKNCFPPAWDSRPQEMNGTLDRIGL